MRAFCRKIKENIPTGAIIAAIIALISTVIILICRLSPEFADFFNYYPSAAFRWLISGITYIIPISLAELLIITLPIWTGLLIYFAVRMAKKGKKQSIRYLSLIISITLCLASVYVWTYSSGFYTTEIDEKMGISDTLIGEKELYDTSKILIDRLNSLSSGIEYDTCGASVMPYGYFEMSKRISLAYDTFTDEYPVIRTFKSRIKPIMLSEPMTYTHISGVYSFMTGEANVNVNYPDFVVASSSAHEMAHQRGVARENEANFVSFAVLTMSDDAFLQYSAYLDVFNYVGSALHRENSELYKELIGTLDEKVRNDLRSYSVFFDKYRDSQASDISDKINNSYLQANGQEQGTKSYGMVTELVCKYLLD